MWKIAIHHCFSAKGYDISHVIVCVCMCVFVSVKEREGDTVRLPAKIKIGGDRRAEGVRDCLIELGEE